MLRLSLLERSILVVEDEPSIALDIAAEFEKRGARVSIANTLKEALASVEADGCLRQSLTTPCQTVTARSCANASTSAASRS